MVQNQFRQHKCFCVSLTFLPLQFSLCDYFLMISMPSGTITLLLSSSRLSLSAGTSLQSTFDMQVCVLSLLSLASAYIFFGGCLVCMVTGLRGASAGLRAMWHCTVGCDAGRMSGQEWLLFYLSDGVRTCWFYQRQFPWLGMEGRPERGARNFPAWAHKWPGSFECLVWVG